MIKIETHCHLKGGSECAHSPVDVGIDAYKKAGYDGIVLTNHIHPVPYLNDYPGTTHKEKMDFWFSLADQFIALMEDRGLRPFIGAEVCVFRPDGKFTECMIYGFDRKFLYDNKPLFYYTQEELFRLADKNKIFMYQTHPFRQFVTTGDAKFMHGAESFNGHIGHENNNALSKKFCLENGLRRMSGTDYHDEGQTIIGGMYIPKEIKDEKALAEYLFNNQPKIIENEELYQKEYRGTP